MKPVTQTRFGCDDGNCWAAALASILEAPLEEVDAALGDPEEAGWWERACAVAAEHGYTLLYAPVGGWYCPEGYAPKGYAIAGGPSPRGCDAGHAVVVEDGWVVWDPHPSGDNLAGPVEQYYIPVPLVRVEEAPPREEDE